MDLNKTIAKVGSGIVTVTVFLFALFLIINYSMGSFFVCLILPLGFIMMTAAFHNECESFGGVLYVHHAGLLYTADHSK